MVLLLLLLLLFAIPFIMYMFRVSYLFYKTFIVLKVYYK